MKISPSKEQNEYRLHWKENAFCSRPGSNRWLLAHKTSALTTELQGLCIPALFSRHPVYVRSERVSVRLVADKCTIRWSYTRAVWVALEYWGDVQKSYPFLDLQSKIKENIFFFNILKHHHKYLKLSWVRWSWEIWFYLLNLK